MSGHVTDAIVVHCIDFRFQKYLDSWFLKRFGHDHFDRVSLAGGVFDFYAVLRQGEISDRLHRIKKVVLITKTAELTGSREIMPAIRLIWKKSNAKSRPFSRTWMSRRITCT